MRTLTVLALSLLASACQSDGTLRPTRFGAEFGVYPTGLHIGPRVEAELSERDLGFIRAATHVVDRGDAGEQDDEEGSGYGFGAGWRRWLDAPGEGWSVGARADLWRLRIDWRDDGPPSRTGLSRVTVFVPAVEGGHSWKLEDGARFDLTLGLGYEFNLDTDGRDVGEGAILTLGASFTGGTRSIRRLHEGRHPVEEPNRDRDVLSQVRVR